MNKVTKKMGLLCTFLLCSAGIKAQDIKNQLNPVYYGVTSLAIAPDARAAGLGDAGAATDPDVNSQYWNPAKYPFCISRSGVSLNYTPWLRHIVSDIDLANLTGYYRICDWHAISGSLRYFSLGEVTVLGSEGESFKPYEMSLDVAYSRMLSETFSAAVALRYIYSDLAYKADDETTPGSAFAADIALYHTTSVVKSPTTRATPASSCLRTCVWVRRSSFRLMNTTPSASLPTSTSSWSLPAQPWSSTSQRPEPLRTTILAIQVG